MADPTDLFAYDEIARVLKRDIQLAVVSESLLLQTIDRVYRRTEEISGLAQELGEELGEAAIDFAALGTDRGCRGRAGRQAAAVGVRGRGAGARLRHPHRAAGKASCMIRFRIDGVLHLQTEADSKIASALVLRLKLMSGLDISEKRLPQDGRFNVKVRNVQIDVRISTMPTQYGESVVMRLLNQSGGILGLDRIGMPARDAGAAARDHPPAQRHGAGDRPDRQRQDHHAVRRAATSSIRTERKIITVEDPVEYRLPGINQVQVHEKIELTFARVLRSALRQDPDVILVGEMRDQETVETGLRAAMTGHMVLSTLHTNDAVSTPIRLLDMGAPRYMVAMSLQVVIAQRLVRMICESCAQAIRAAAERARMAAQRAGRRGGCDNQYLQGARLLAMQRHRLPRPHRGLRNAGDDAAGGRGGQPAGPGACSSRPRARRWQATRCTDHAVAAGRSQGTTTVDEAMRVSTPGGRLMAYFSPTRAAMPRRAGAGRARGRRQRRGRDQLFGTGVTPVEIGATAAPRGRRIGGLLARFDKRRDRPRRPAAVQPPDVYAAQGRRADHARARRPAGIGQQPDFQGCCRNMRESLDSGRELSVALQRQDGVFSPFYVAMVYVGETTGRLEEIFLRLFNHLEFQELMREQVKSALRYPIFVVVAMAIAIVIINLFVIPAFAKVYKGFNAELPLITQLLIGFSDFMVATWPFLLAALVGAVFAFRCYTAHQGRAATRGTVSSCASRSPARSC